MAPFEPPCKKWFSVSRFAFQFLLASPRPKAQLLALQMPNSWRSQVLNMDVGGPHNFMIRPKALLVHSKLPVEPWLNPR
jgi:hypothetical protein